MNDKRILVTLIVMLTLLLGASQVAGQQGGPQSPQGAYGSAFTYQGQLRGPGGPVNGTCDLRFKLFNAASGGSQVGSTLTREGVGLVDGLFTVRLDFGAGAFQGDERWLAIEVRCPAGSGNYVTLSPRQELTAAPYALALPGLWTQPNATSPNLIGGYSANRVAAGVVGASIGGGGLAGAVNGVYGNYGVVGGGAGNSAYGELATVAGGDHNSAGILAMVGGGNYNHAQGDYSVVAGGDANHATGNHTFIGGGLLNYAGGPMSVIGGGESISVTGHAATVAGGAHITVTGDYAAVGGGYGNTVSGARATVGGGGENTASGGNATVGGGYANTASGAWATVGGGAGNTVSGNYATVGGGAGNTASGFDATVGGGYANTANGGWATVGGGGHNRASGNRATVGGGEWNTAGGGHATISGGQENTASGALATVGGGYHNLASDNYGTVAGGYNNRAGDDAGAPDDRPYATVGGGRDNIASGTSSVVVGGDTNTASGWRSTVVGGVGNVAAGEHSLAAGRRAKANSNGCFVWADSNDIDVACNDVNRTIFRSSGGFYIYTNSGLTSGMYLSAGGSSWNAVSDRTRKENFQPVNTRELLERLAAIEISTWNYAAQDLSIRHIGPMADEFNGLVDGLGGEGANYINSLDADGVALAAIQALYAENRALESRVTDLEARLAALETQVSGSATSTVPIPWMLASGGLFVCGIVVAQRRHHGGGR